MGGAGNTFFQINQSMTAHHSGPGPDLSRVGVGGSQVNAWRQFRAKLVPPAMVEAIPAGRQPAEATLEGVPVGWRHQPGEPTNLCPSREDI